MIALRRLEHLAKDGPIPQADQFDRYEQDLLDDLVQELIENYAFKGLTQDLISACRVLALVRQFDVILLREVLTQTLPNFQKDDRLEFGAILSSLRATQIVLWDDRRKGYALDATFRHILGEHICRRQPKLYADVNRVALRVYQDWIERAGDNRGVYVVEELYQQACLNRVREQVHPEEYIDLAVLFRTRLNEYHPYDTDLRFSALDRLYHEIEDDHELSDLIGQPKFEQLLDLLRQERAEIRNRSNA
jgi:hypothetical protein